MIVHFVCLLLLLFCFIFIYYSYYFLDDIKNEIKVLKALIKATSKFLPQSNSCERPKKVCASAQTFCANRHDLKSSFFLTTVPSFQIYRWLTISEIYALIPNFSIGIQLVLLI